MKLDRLRTHSCARQTYDPTICIVVMSLRFSQNNVKPKCEDVMQYGCRFRNIHDCP
jgi:hypothetical protein